MCRHCHTEPQRNPIHCILPPYVLEEVARRGSAEQRDWALRNLSVDATTRSLRATTQLMASMAPAGRFALLAPVAAKLERTIYSEKGGTSLPGKVVRNEGGPATGDPAEDEAYDYLGNTFDFYWKTYQRNSIDDRGLPLDATVHFGQRYNNAFWNGQQMVFGDGDGVIFDRFTIDVDVVGHELTHGVTGSEVNLVYLGQSGALNESVSDVFGIMIKQYAQGLDSQSSDWLIGAHLLKVPPPGQALRSMKAPGTAYNNNLLGKDPQPAKMSDYVNTTGDNGGVHINSGIPNYAFFLVATKLGGKPWERAGQIWYDTIRDKQLQANATFSDFAARTVFNAGHRYGTNSAEQNAVKDAWKAVEVT